MPDKFFSFRRWIQRHWIIVIGLFLVVLLISSFLYFQGLPSREWIGFDDYTGPKVEEGREFQRGKTLWDWMELLIVPAVLAGVALWFSQAERKGQREMTVEQAREAALREYLDSMTTLLLEHKLSESERDAEVRVVARARTLAVLPQLDGKRKGILLRFLYESVLIGKRDTNEVTVRLDGADFSGIQLERGNIGGANLNGTNLVGADFTQANLSMNLPGSTVFAAGLNVVTGEGTAFGSSNLQNACLRKADLTKAFLRKADLTGADLRDAKLLGANLMDATLKGVDMRGADLTAAAMNKANLHRAIVDDAQLAQAASLHEAIMPDGRLYDGRFNQPSSSDTP